ncbi:Sister chromatid cohesion protein DCC1 [Aphelenchoides bicaudatus]|nr:Sister chromatid cohesion protein DCC1 [Aphelenchoides bicaudatus]
MQLRFERKLGAKKAFEFYLLLFAVVEMEVDENTKPPIEAEQLEKIHKALKGILDTAASRPVDAINYSEPFEPTNFKLIEVTEELAAHVLDGKEFYISGAPDDQMVLCTKDRTFNAKEVERSNSMLLTNITGLPANINELNCRAFTVSSILVRNIELAEAPLNKPERFREILSACEVNVFDDEAVFPEKRTTFSEIFSALPLSEGQVTCLLNKYPIFEIDGRVLCLNMEGRGELINEFAYFLSDCDIEHVRESDISESSVFSSMSKQFPQQVAVSLTHWILRMFFERFDESFHKLSHEKVLHEICTHILRKHAKDQFIGLNEIEKQVYRLVPASIAFDVKFLRGIAFVKNSADGQKVAKYLNSEELPLNDKERLEELFRLSSLWSLEDIEPYILDFVDSKNAYEFLAKRCRSGQVDGKTMFYSGYPC